MQSIKSLISVLIIVYITLFYQPVLAHESRGEVIIHMSEQGFVPGLVTIQVGDTITFENIGSSEMWPASNLHPTHRSYPGTDIRNCNTNKATNSFDACKGLKPREMYSFTFNHAGEWRYHDHLNSQLAGTITVVGDQPAKTQEQQESAAQGGSLVSYLKNLWFRVSTLFWGQPTPPQADEPHRLYNALIAQDATTLYVSDDDLYSYVKKFGPEKAVKQLHVLSATYGNCHDVAHEAGRFAYELNGEKAFQSCSAECHSGCYHGATEAYFREHGTDKLTENLPVICDSNLNPFFNHQCIHGVGHGLMAWYDYDIHQALKSCDILPVASQKSCYSGVFMENVVGGLADEHRSRYLSDDPHYPCNVVEDKYEGACYHYQTSRAVTLYPGDFQKVAEFCDEAPAPYQTGCFGSMGRDVGGMTRSKPEKAIEYCQFAPAGTKRNECLMGAVQDYFWDESGQGKALAFCKLLENDEEKDGCYATISARAAFVLNSSASKASFCDKAEEEYQSQCKATVSYSL